MAVRSHGDELDRRVGCVVQDRIRDVDALRRLCESDTDRS
jgi:hypothetical protein